jgi:hypothetical protein
MDAPDGMVQNFHWPSDISPLVDFAVIAALPEPDANRRTRYWVPWVQEEFRKPYADWIDDLVGMTATSRFPAGFHFWPSCG